jgi:hypothetical protein
LTPHITRRNGFVALAAGLTTATALVAAPAASAAQPAPTAPRHQDCVSTEVTERTVATQPEGPAGPPLESVGDGATYFDKIYDSSGAQIGTAVGYYVVVSKRPGDGHLIAHYEENVHLLDGSLRDSGTVDRTAIIEGGWARFAAVGTGGRYQGEGVRQWRVIDVPTLTADVQILLCR